MRSASPIVALRRRLTLWYVGVFACILTGFGVVVYGTVVWQTSARLDRSLVTTVEAAGRLVTTGQGDAAAITGMLTPGRRVFFLWEDESSGAATSPGDEWIARALRRTFAEGNVRARVESEDETTWRLYASVMAAPGGRRVAVAAVVDAVELEDEHPDLLLGFLVAGVASLALVALGGWRLARRSLEPVDRAFGQMRRFMADAAHELRTPLAVVRGHADVALQQPREPDGYITALSDISREASRMGDIVEQLLLLARADAGDWPAARDPFYLDDVVLDVANAGIALGAARQVRVEVVRVDEAPVAGDQGLVRQLLLALVDNAVKYSPVGGVVQVSLETQDGSCSVHVDDQGPGIPADIRSHIFERFYRGDSARGRQSGAGLGLSIAAWIADLHGGRLTVDTAGERGARLTFALPTAAASSG